MCVCVCVYVCVLMSANAIQMFCEVFVLSDFCNSIVYSMWKF